MYNVKIDCSAAKKVIADDMILTKGVATTAGSKMLESRSWVMVTARINAEKHRLYKGDMGPVLTAMEVVQGVSPAEPDVCTF